MPVGAPATPGVLAELDLPPPPARHVLAPLAPERAELAMWSYTRLARDAAALDEPADESRVPVAAGLDTSGSAGTGPLTSGGPRSAAEGRRGDLVDELPPGARSGIFVHDLLERADLALLRHAATVEAWLGRPEVSGWLLERARACGVDTRFVGHAAALVYRALVAPLVLVDGSTLPPLSDARALAREVEFAYPIPGDRPRGFIRGFIDALVAWDDELWIVDYKTDVLAGDASAVARERAADPDGYGLQARIYAIAAQRLRGERRLAGVLFAFVRHGVVARVATPDDAIAAWTQALASARVAGEAP
jgi:hypothetical protein